MSGLEAHDEDLRALPNPDLFEPDDLVWDASSLITAAATQISDQLNNLVSGELVTERIWLERMYPVQVKEGHLEEGTLDWVVYLRSPGLRVTKAVTLTYPVENGKISDARYFKDIAGRVIPLTREHLLNYVHFGIK